MNRFVTILTAASILAHSVLGCCAHEAHLLDCSGCKPRRNAPVAAQDTHQHSPQHSPQQSLQCGNTSCCQHASAQPAAEHGRTAPPTLWRSSDSEGSAPHCCCHDCCYWPVPEARVNADRLASQLLMRVEQLGNNPPRLPCRLTGDQVPWPDLSPHRLAVRTHLAKSVLIV